MSELMWAVVKAHRSPGLELREVPIPVPQADEVLIEVQAVSICGTDLQLYDWTPWAQQRVVRTPFIQGHELCGLVVECGSEVEKLSPGDFVSAESHIVDYGGEYYRRGLAHVAPETQIIGIDRDGGFARFVALPWRNARRNRPDLPLEAAVLKENFGNAVHVGFKVDVESRNVLITGAGPAGLMTVQVVKARGAGRIFVSETNAYRRDFAARLGADVVVDPRQGNLRQEVLDRSNGRGIDVLLEMSGAQAAIDQGLDLLRPGGQVIAFGLPQRPISLDLAQQVIFKGLTLHGVVGRRLWETWEQMETLLDESRVDLPALVTHRFKLGEFEKAFRQMQGGACGKVMMTP